MASEPFNIKKIIPNDSIVEVKYFEDIPPYDIEDYESVDDEAYIKDLEKFCRNSIEYREWVNYLREYMDMNSCAFFKNVSNVDTFSIKIHLHHTPITLMEICVIVIQKRKFYAESLELEAVAKEVMYLHYCLIVGIIPLCETVHELVHNLYIFVPNTSVLGNYKYFMENYGPWIPPQIQSKLDRIEEWSKVYNETDNENILKRNLIMIDMGEEGVGYNLPKMEDVAKLVQAKIEDLFKNNFQTGPIPLVIRKPR